MWEVRPGAQDDYLAAVREQKVPIMEDYGHRLTGLYEVSNNRHEVIVVWATSIAARTAFHKARYTSRGWCDEGTVDDRIANWDQAALTWVTAGNERHMTPLPRTVYGPDDWEDATLEMWLEGN